MGTALLILQLLVSLLLATTILLQARGTGLGTAWGNLGTTSWRTKRGAERVLFTATIILSVIFVILAIINALS